MREEQKPVHLLRTEPNPLKTKALASLPLLAVLLAAPASAGTPMQDTLPDLAAQAAKETGTAGEKANNLHVTPSGALLTTEDASSLTAGPAFALGSTGAQVGGTLDRGAWALGAQVIYTPEMQSAFLAAGFKITQDITGIFTVSTASESAAKALGDERYQGKLQAVGFSLGAHIRQAFVRFVLEQGKDKNLLTEQGVQVSEQDMGTFLRQTTLGTTTETLWDAFTRQTIVGGYAWDIGDNWQVTASAGASHDQLHGTQLAGGLGVAYYGGDWEFSAGARRVQDQQFLVTGSVMKHIDSHTSIGVNARYVPAYDGVKEDIAVLGAVEYSFKPMPKRHNRSGAAQALSPANLVNSAFADPTPHVRPRSLGAIRIETTTDSVTTRDIANAPKEIPAGSIRTRINHDGSVTVTYLAQQNGWKYEYKIDASTPSGMARGSATGGWLDAGTGSVTTAALTAGGYIIHIREMNPISGVTGPSSSVTLTLAADNPTEVPGYSVSADQTTATAQVSLFDRDGIQNLTCQVLTQNGVPVGSKVTPTSGSCTISGLSPDTGYTFFEEALAKMVNPDGTVVLGLVQNYAPFRTAAEVVVTPVCTPESLACWCELHPESELCIRG